MRLRVVLATTLMFGGLAVTVPPALAATLTTDITTDLIAKADPTGGPNDDKVVQDHTTSYSDTLNASSGGISGSSQYSLAATTSAGGLRYAMSGTEDGTASASGGFQGNGDSRITFTVDSPTSWRSTGSASVSSSSTGGNAVAQSIAEFSLTGPGTAIDDRIESDDGVGDTSISFDHSGTLTAGSYELVLGSPCYANGTATGTGHCHS
jgi:hypothetical protein